MDEKAKYLTKREVAAEEIRNAIETGFYRPGQVVSQRQIGQELGLSVTPIREAIIQLSATGLIERHSHHSIKIKEVDVKRLQDIYHVRYLLEEEALKLTFPALRSDVISALKRINRDLAKLIDSESVNQIQFLDRQFHRVLFSKCPNETLSSAIEIVKSSFSVYALWRNPGRLATSVAEHEALIGRLEASDLGGSIRAYRDHLESGLRAAAGVEQS